MRPDLQAKLGAAVSLCSPCKVKMGLHVHLSARPGTCPADDSVTNGHQDPQDAQAEAASSADVLCVRRCDEAGTSQLASSRACTRSKPGTAAHPAPLTAAARLAARGKSSEQS